VVDLAADDPEDRFDEYTGDPNVNVFELPELPGVPLELPDNGLPDELLELPDNGLPELPDNGLPDVPVELPDNGLPDELLELPDNGLPDALLDPVDIFLTGAL